MARVIETPQEFEVMCPHCFCRIAFTIDDVWSSYTRGLESCDGWLDADCVWNYIHCPNCNKVISVDGVIPYEIYSILKEKYKREG